MEPTPIPSTLLLSTQGSDRASAYTLSNKVVRLGGKIYATWLDAAPEKGGRTRLQLAVINAATHTVERTMFMGEACDNHCGAALAFDHEQRLHMIIGAHGGTFYHRSSATPEDLESWSQAEPVGDYTVDDQSPAFGGYNTYPTLVADSRGTLHLLYRENSEPWTLQYRSKTPGRDWSAAITVAISPMPGYNNYMQSLSVGPDDALHLFFQLHFTETGNSADCETRKAVYLCSRDGGTTWLNEDAPCVLPLTLDSARSFLSYPGEKWRIANHVVDAEGCPWIFASLPSGASSEGYSQAHGGLFRRRGAETSSTGRWERIETGPEFAKLNFHGPMGREVSLSRGTDGVIHIVAATRPDDVSTRWFDPAHELFHLRLSAKGTPLSLNRLTRPSARGAQWLPALENWAWARPESEHIDSPWLLYTHGNNLGGIGGDNNSLLQTDVHLINLGASPVHD